MRVVWTPLARQRLAEVERYIARNHPKAARDMSARLVRASSRLAAPPLLGKRLRQYDDVHVRELLVRPFRLIFRVTPLQIEVVTIMHYRQLLPSDLAALK